MMVRAGSSLLVLRTAQRNGDVPIHVADNGHLTFQPESSTRRTVVRVRKGDTLTQLARRYGVSPVSVAGWNKLGVNAKLKIGQRITLMLPQRATTSRAASKKVPVRTTSKKPVRTNKAPAKASASKSGGKPSSSSKRPPG
jgi:membrane-bound lytic murein transglycosylase D